MSYVNFENGVTPLNDENLNQMQKVLMELVFPIGSTYITQDTTNPSEILKFGTWERLKGKVCLGVDEDDEDLNEIGKTGGEKTHTLTIEQLPRHRFMLNLKRAGSGENETNQWGVDTTQKDNMGDDFTEYIGENQPHNNMQPYEVVGYMWIRRA